MRINRNGNILVGDRAEFTMRIFTAAGKQVAQFGRKGKGPGEVDYLAWMYRCGDKVYTFDIDPHQVPVYFNWHESDPRYANAYRRGVGATGRGAWREIPERD